MKITDTDMSPELLNLCAWCAAHPDQMRDCTYELDDEEDDGTDDDDESKDNR